MNTVLTTIKLQGTIMARTAREFIASLPKKEREAIEARARELVAEEMSLQEVRKALGKTQVAVAKRLKIGQDAVSKLEDRSDMLISTLRSYLQSFGGDLELIAKLPDRQPVRLTSFDEVRPERGHKRGRRMAAATA